MTLGGKGHSGRGVPHLNTQASQSLCLGSHAGHFPSSLFSCSGPCLVTCPASVCPARPDSQEGLPGLDSVPSGLSSPWRPLSACRDRTEGPRLPGSSLPSPWCPETPGPWTHSPDNSPCGREKEVTSVASSPSALGPACPATWRVLIQVPAHLLPRLLWFWGRPCIGSKAACPEVTLPLLKLWMGPHR